MKLIFEKYLPVKEIINKYDYYEIWFWFGIRRNGKTKGAVDIGYENWRKGLGKFVILKRTWTEVELAIKNGDYGDYNDDFIVNSSGFFLKKEIEIEKKNRKGEVYRIDKKIVEGEKIGAFLAYNQPSKLRGYSDKAFYTIIPDEMIPEHKSEYLSGEKEKLQSIITTLCGLNKKLIIYTANRGDRDAPIWQLLGVKNIPKINECKFYPQRKIAICHAGWNNFLKEKYKNSTAHNNNANSEYEKYAFGENEKWLIDQRQIVNPRPTKKLNFVANFSYMNNKFAYYVGENYHYLSTKLQKGKIIGLHKLDKMNGLTYQFDGYGRLFANLVLNKRLEVENLQIQEIIREIIKKI